MYCLMYASMCQAQRWNVESLINVTTWFPFLKELTICSRRRHSLKFMILIQTWNPAENRSRIGFPMVLLLSYRMRMQLSVERELMWYTTLKGSRVFSQGFIFKRIIPITLPWFCSLLRKHENRLDHLFRSPYFHSRIT